jgi:hypothetical protein
MAVRSTAARLAMVGVAGLVVLGGAGTVLLGGERAGIQMAGSVARAEVTSTSALGLWPARRPPQPAPLTTATTTAPTTAPTTSAAPVTTAPVPQPGPLTAPKAGAYVYDTTQGGVTWKGNAGSTVNVSALPNERATVMRHIRFPPLSEHGTVDSIVAWGPAGATERASNIVPGGVWKPPWERYVAELSVGRWWTYDTHLVGWMQPPPGDKGPGTTFDFHLKGTRRVTGTQIVTVSGQPMATWTIEIDETLVMPLVNFTRTLRTVATEQLAPSIGLPVTRREVISGGEQRVERNWSLPALPS